MLLLRWMMVLACVAWVVPAWGQERLQLDTTSHEMERGFSRSGVGVSVGTAVSVRAGAETRLDFEGGGSEGGHLEVWLQTRAGIWYEEWVEASFSSWLATPVVVGGAIESAEGSAVLPVRGAHVLEGSVFAAHEGGILVNFRGELLHEGVGPRPGSSVTRPSVPFFEAAAEASGALRIGLGDRPLASIAVLPQLTGGIRYTGFTDPTALLGSRVETTYSIRYPGVFLRTPDIELEAFVGSWDMRWYDYEHGVIAERMLSDIGFLVANGRFWIHGVLLTAKTRVGFSFIEDTDALPFAGELRLGISMDAFEVGLATAQQNVWGPEGHRWISDWRSELLFAFHPESWRTSYELRLFYSELSSLTRGSSRQPIDRFGLQALADVELFPGGDLGLSLRSSREVLDSVGRWDPWQGLQRWTHEFGLYFRWDILDLQRTF